MENIKPKKDHSVFETELSGAVLNFQLLARIFFWLRPYRLKLVLSAILVLIASFAAVLLEILISRVLVDYIIMKDSDSLMPDMGMISLTQFLERETQFGDLFSVGLLFFSITVIQGVTGHWHRMTLTASIVKGLRDLRQDLFEHLETRPSSFYDKVPVGRLMTRVTNDVEALFEMLRGFGSLIGEFIPFFVALAIMFSASIKLTFILLALIPVVWVVTFIFKGATREIFREVRDSVSALNQRLQESLSGIQVVQLSVRESRNFLDYSVLNKLNRRLEFRSINISTFYGAFNDSLIAIGLGMVIWFGAEEVLSDSMTLGGVILFTRFMTMLFTPVVSLGEQLSVLFRAMASGERIFQALDWDEQIKEPESPSPLPDRLLGRIEFKDLSFSYNPGEPVLRNVSFSVAAGEKLAIVGPTGSGKSTLIRLLGRFYDFSDGSIFLDGIDLNQILSRELRRRVGVVLQDFHVFSGSIYENISLGNPLVTKKKAQEAALITNAHDFISRLPQGYDTVMLERGANLSHGQRQLLAFARVLAADPEVLVLDEATASVDTETELLIEKGLESLIQNRTAILIAHRLQTVRKSDRILVLNEGKVAEFGTEKELLSNRDLYHKLHQLQFQDK
jgi:ATP-binding cassette subfamily B multidrug efflux pump